MAVRIEGRETSSMDEGLHGDGIYAVVLKGLGFVMERDITREREREER